MTDRPNILLIMSDEHDPAVTGCYGDPLVQTPNLDRLASRGTTFDAAYTTSPLCVPARLSFTAGKYVSRCGAWSNSTRLPSDDYPSIAWLLQSAGYDTPLAGKMHFDPNRRYGFRELYFSRTNNYPKHGKGGRRDPDDTSVVTKSWTSRSEEFYVAEDSWVMEHDRRVTDESLRYLQSRTPDDPPFMLLSGYLAPHFPLIVPQRYAARYRGRVPMPELPEGLLESLPRNYRQLRLGFGNAAAEAETERLGRELYWAFVDWFDDEVGRLLDGLDNSAVADNTVVVYCSDHGENKGDHGLWWKNNMYEHSARMPLIVSWPARWSGGQRRTGACSLVDLVQTLAELAGATTPDDWDGDSMLAWLDDPSTPWKDLAVTEYYGHNIASGMAMIRQGPWKYVYHCGIDEAHPPEIELYDLEEDPREFNNLADHPEHAQRIRAMHLRLEDETGRSPQEAEKECRLDYARGYEDVSTEK